jgi:hypothetical protein
MESRVHESGIAWWNGACSDVNGKRKFSFTVTMSRSGWSRFTIGRDLDLLREARRFFRREDPNGELLAVEQIYVRFVKIHMRSVFPVDRGFYWDVYPLQNDGVRVFGKTRVCVRTGIIVNIPKGFCGYVDGVFIDHFKMVKSDNQLLYPDDNFELKVWVHNMDDDFFDVTGMTVIARVVIMRTNDITGLYIE